MMSKSDRIETPRLRSLLAVHQEVPVARDADHRAVFKGRAATAGGKPYPIVPEVGAAGVGMQPYASERSPAGEIAGPLQIWIVSGGELFPHRGDAGAEVERNAVASLGSDHSNHS